MIGNPRHVAIQVLMQPTFTSVQDKTCALVVSQLGAVHILRNHVGGRGESRAEFDFVCV
jgi:hypothetical protein